MSRIFTFSTFATALLLAFILTACSSVTDQPASETTPQARQVATTETLFALHPEDVQSAYRMDLTFYTDGTTDAVRTVVPYDGNEDYHDYYYLGTSNLAPSSNGGTIATFPGETFFIPFDGEVNVEQVFFAIGGSLGLDCQCRGLGQCDESMSIGITGSIGTGCDGYFCGGGCSSRFDYGGGGSIGYGNRPLGAFVSTIGVSAF